MHHSHSSRRQVLKCEASSDRLTSLHTSEPGQGCHAPSGGSLNGSARNGRHLCNLLILCEDQAVRTSRISWPYQAGFLQLPAPYHLLAGSC